jgi:micrococcal nuclease
MVVRLALAIIVGVLYSVLPKKQADTLMEEVRKSQVLGDLNAHEVGTVTRIVDGDTLVIDGDKKVRLIGIDTPELQGHECYSEEATLALTQKVFYKEVILEKDMSESDRYDRLLRYIWLGDEMVNEEMVREGYAEAHAYKPDVKYRERLEQVEAEAKIHGLGMWEACN